MNSIARGIWLLINLFFGAGLAYTLFHWVACDMQMPLIMKDLVSNYIPILNPVFDVPYIQIHQFSSSLIAKLIFNAFLFAIFGFVHTLFAQEYVQMILNRFGFPKQTRRTVYCLLVTITVFIIMGFWQYTHIQLWNWLPSTMNQYQRQLVLLILFHVVVGPSWYVFMKFNIFEFAGLNQIFEKFDTVGCPYSSSVKSEKRTSGNQKLITSGLFRLCRHPVYLFTLLAWIITPVMSLDHLMIIIYTCLYLPFGIAFEERKLIQIFGQDYIDYQQHVPAIIPFSMRKTKQN